MIRLYEIHRSPFRVQPREVLPSIPFVRILALYADVIADQLTIGPVFNRMTPEPGFSGYLSARSVQSRTLSYTYIHLLCFHFHSG